MKRPSIVFSWRSLCFSVASLSRNTALNFVYSLSWFCSLASYSNPQHNPTIRKTVSEGKQKSTCPPPSPTHHQHMTRRGWKAHHGYFGVVHSWSWIAPLSSRRPRLHCGARPAGRPEAVVHSSTTFRATKCSTSTTCASTSALRALVNMAMSVMVDNRVYPFT